MEERTRKLMEMGFPEKKVTKALRALAGDTDENIVSYLTRKEANNFPEFVSEKRVRGTPVGIQNIGNSCYFSSLIQSYFMIPEFYKLIMSLESVGVVKKFQKIFANLTACNAKYITPTSLFRVLRNSDSIEQRDIGEFNLQLIEALEDSIALKNAESPFFPIFYGVQREFVQKKSIDLKQKNKGVCSQINLDVTKDSDLYSAWNSAFFHDVVDNGQLTAQVSTYLKTLPKILMFQLNRVVYDRDQQRQLKENRHFSFPQVLYPTRFMHKNKNLMMNLQGQLTEVNKEISKNQEMLNVLMNVGGAGSLRNILYIAKEVIKLQDCDTDSPLKLDIDQGYLQYVETAHYILNLAQEKAQAKIEALEQRIAELTTQRNQLFEIDQLKEQAYTLHSILIHDGAPEFGHYYTFIYDSYKMAWRKYSDTLVKEVSQEEVFRESFGGTGSTSAYWLIYTDQQMLNPEIQCPLRTFSLNLEENDFYTKLIPSKIKEKMLLKNNANESAISEREITRTVKKVRDTYFKCVNDIENDIQSRLNNAFNDFVLKLSSPFAYLRSIGQKNASNNLLLDYCVKETTGKEVTDYQNADVMAQLLNLHVVLNPREEENSKKAIEYYKIYILLLKIQLYTHQCILNQDFCKAFKAYMYLLGNQFKDNQIEKFNFKRSFEVLLFRMISHLMELTRLKDYEKLISLACCLDFAHKCLIEDSDVANQILMLNRVIIIEAHKNEQGAFNNKLRNLQDVICSQDISPENTLYDREPDLEAIIAQSEQINVLCFNHDLIFEFIDCTNKSNDAMAKWINRRAKFGASRRFYSLDEWVKEDR